MILAAAVGWCMVQETYKQTRARYELAELASREDNARKVLAKLKAEENALRSPIRIARLVREKFARLTALGVAVSVRHVPDDGTERRLGTVLDETFVDGDGDIRMAAAQGR
jgi:hypothetical protein